ncbi:TadE/TadG family type IV pilus assembly protein [Stakelama tenebrarum]|uniref:Pilus assembly protein n=1 Tax=Stakelama tenebrarum TaxID=2711215 RepID=A0A6G6Y530_9SPHN|nr:TadE/TadG family type IV pilus assembly protein [Sphingosinithalassobacter tenebrarum]QIG79907.1 pilus assembly protein [Sphingosinithalassobacter tenebrarum]
MSLRNQRQQRSARGFLAALARDVRANTMAIMGLALIPLAGMVGGGIDISRMYIVKTRLQHACDAGALAGRKAMGAGTWSANNFAAREAAEEFFEANITTSPYGASSVEKEFTESGGKVTGAATATLPMTLMRIFGDETETLSVTCDAEMRLPNTDVMFVLDVTGSMGSKAVNTDTQTKIASLRSAVKCFYEVVARRDTTEDCSGGNQSGGTGQVQVRFGFVPYNTNVNVGRLLPTAYFADTWEYQTRRPHWSTSTSYQWVEQPSTPGSGGNESGDWSNWTNYGSAQYFSCPAYPPNSSTGPTTTTYDTQVVTNGNTRTWETRTVTGYVDTQYQTIATGIMGWACQVQQRTRTRGTYTSVVHSEVRQAVTEQSFDGWDYGQYEQDISGLKDGTDWNSYVNLPIGDDGADVPVYWDGCIEERETIANNNQNVAPTDANDLNIDMIPDQSDHSTLWAPALPGAIFLRGAGQYDNASSTNQWSYSAIIGTTNQYRGNPQYYCPPAARKLQEWNSASGFESYVNALNANGNTYHDIGLLWGARLVSPDGIFGSENATTPSGGSIVRHVIFMTDGDTVAQNYDYAAYGLPWFDRRQNSNGQAPSSAEMDHRVNARFLDICTKIKNKNITLWVISFGNGTNNSTEMRLENCASPGRYRTARDSEALQQTFSAIAGEISQLRLTG